MPGLFSSMQYTAALQTSKLYADASVSQDRKKSIEDGVPYLTNMIKVYLPNITEDIVGKKVKNDLAYWDAFYTEVSSKSKSQKEFPPLTDNETNALKNDLAAYFLNTGSYNPTGLKNNLLKAILYEYAIETGLVTRQSATQSATTTAKTPATTPAKTPATTSATTPATTSATTPAKTPSSADSMLYNNKNWDTDYMPFPVKKEDTDSNPIRDAIVFFIFFNWIIGAIVFVTSFNFSNISSNDIKRSVITFIFGFWGYLMYETELLS